MIKNLIFDLGGVLFEENWEVLNREMVENYGVSILIRSKYGREINALYDQITLGERDITDLFKIICRKDKVSKICKFYKEAYSKNKRLNYELIKFIKNLKKDYLLICLTDTNRLHLESHKQQGIIKLFDKCFTSFNLKRRKQQRGTFQKILKRLDIAPKETLFIDDNQTNINIAKSVGIKTILFKDNQKTIEKIKSGYEENLYIEIPIPVIPDLLVIVPLTVSEKGESNMKEIKGYSWNAVKCCEPKPESEKTENKITASSSGESVYILRDSTNFNEPGIAYQINFDKETNSIIEKTFNRPSVLFGNWENYEIYKYPDDYVNLFCKYEVLDEKTFSINQEAGNYALDSFEVSVPENSFDSAKLTIKKLALVNCDKENVFTEDYKEASNLDFLFQSLKAFTKGQISLKRILEIIRELVRS